MSTWKQNFSIDLSGMADNIKNEIQPEISANRQEIVAVKADLASLKDQVKIVEENSQNQKIE